MSRERVEFGARAQGRAEEYLVAQGFVILARNFYIRGGELDLVARCDDVVHFIEVRARMRRGAVAPEESITARKRQALVRAAQTFLSKNPELQAFPAQFDLCAIEGEEMRWAWNIQL